MDDAPRAAATGADHPARGGDAGIDDDQRKVVQAAGAHAGVDLRGVHVTERARQGVAVHVIAPGSKNDLPLAKLGQRYLYKELLGAGVKIYEYQPAMMHAKTMIIDDRLAVIGSLNLNLLSLSRLDEAVFVVDDPRLVERLDENWRRDLSESREVTARH